MRSRKSASNGYEIAYGQYQRKLNYAKIKTFNKLNKLFNVETS